MVSVRLGEYRKAFEAGERLLDRGATLSETRLFRHPWGSIALDQIRGRHHAILERLIRERPRSPWARYYRAVFDNGRVSEFLSLLKGWPHRRYGWMRIKIGQWLLLDQRFEESLEHFEAALAYRPFDWLALGFLAEANACLGRRREALRHLDRALSKAPAEETAGALAWRGELKLWHGDYQGALGDLDEACRRGAQWAHCWRGAAKLKLGKTEEALADLDQALRMHPVDHEASVWRGEARRLLGRYDEALRDLSHEPAGAWSLFNRALVKRALKDDEGMRRDFFALPKSIRDCVQRRSRLKIKPDSTSEEIERSLEGGLKLARGYRREELYGNAVWMRRSARRSRFPGF